MSYVQDNLLPKEEIILIEKINLWALLMPITIGILLLPVFGFGLLFLIAAAMEYFSTELALTNKRVIAKFGFIRRTTVEISLLKVETIQVRQGFVGRIFNFGDIVVTGAGNPQAIIPGIDKPLNFRRKFLELQDSVQSVPGPH
jgi:uncharacterized membrane protein YdbT with pleckstrin-like domain